MQNFHEGNFKFSSVDYKVLEFSCSGLQRGRKREREKWVLVKNNPHTSAHPLPLHLCSTVRRWFRTYFGPQTVEKRRESKGERAVKGAFGKEEGASTITRC